MTLVLHHLHINGSLKRTIFNPLQRRSISLSAIKMGISNYASQDGEFRRKDSSFRNHIEVGGKYPPEKDRYHLYVSWACPWGTSLIIYLTKLVER
jgi:glutathionyl-hydroquinone reductase